MAKGTPTNGTNFTRLHPWGVPGVPYTITAKTPTVIVEAAFNAEISFQPLYDTEISFQPLFNVNVQTKAIFDITITFLDEAGEPVDEYWKGQTVVVKADITKYNPTTNTSAANTPTTKTATLIDPNRKALISLQAMTERTTGAIYYTAQTDESWIAGNYKAVVRLSDGTYNGLEVGEFKLKSLA